MFYHLHNFSEYFGPLRLFEYISFRAGGAFFRLLCYIKNVPLSTSFEGKINSYTLLYGKTSAQLFLKAILHQR